MSNPSGGNAAHVRYGRARMVISAPYDAGFVNLLKEGTRSRRWNPKDKLWTVALNERDKVLEIANHFYDVIEDNSPSSDAVQRRELSIVPLTIETGDHVDIWTDGACLVNPGPGAYAVVISHEGIKTEMVGGFKLTTNNRMEIMGAIVALETIPDGCKVSIYSDSQYLVKAMMNGWVKTWRAKDWEKKGKRVPNHDLWAKLSEICSKHEAEFKWVKGHNDQPENERCNELAAALARTSDLPVDEGYEGRDKKGT